MVVSERERFHQNGPVSPVLRPTYFAPLKSMDGHASSSAGLSGIRTQDVLRRLGHQEIPIYVSYQANNSRMDDFVFIIVP